MTFAKSRDKIIDLLEASTPTTSVAGSGSSFKFIDAGETDRLGRTRSFFIALRSGSIGGVLTSMTRIYVVDLDVSVFYRNVRSQKQMDEIMISDYEVLTESLINNTQWDFSTTGLRRVTVAGENILNFEIDEDENGVIMTITVQMEYE
ncbi:MAG TPA: hypothetical protein DCW74_01025 [Alteromonas australica]|uniref:Uncharacterized protein n=1 Tax=Alteromonas australica TaxID=589873 RepID=A0A350NZ34_9ALTE|nr:hypothetical protein [Alteromonas australica]|tara:strand:- start:358 stop:801 length:444 start_codon:yes stop_codon:yes gene_type:complete